MNVRKRGRTHLYNRMDRQLALLLKHYENIRGNFGVDDWLHLKKILILCEPVIKCIVPNAPSAPPPPDLEVTGSELPRLIQGLAIVHNFDHDWLGIYLETMLNYINSTLLPQHRPIKKLILRDIATALNATRAQLENWEFL